MNDKELAEKVAKKLGGEFVECGDELHFSKDGFIEGANSFYDWPTFGLMVEDAERRGWLPTWNYGRFQFDEIAGIGHTEVYHSVQHGHIKACALAYLQIPDLAPSGNLNDGDTR
jgi:hypothetical protein